MPAGINNSIDKTNIIPKYGPERAGFAVKRSDQRIWFDTDGTQRPINTDNAITITADRTLVAKESGTKIVVDAATSKIVTLPAAARGLEFRVFVKQVPGSGVGVLIKVNGSSAKIYSKVSPTGAAISESAGKGIVNTQATAVKGDGAHVWSDGTDWFATVSGTWAREA
jgi:hypothetical protein